MNELDGLTERTLARRDLVRALKRGPMVDQSELDEVFERLIADVAVTVQRLSPEERERWAENWPVALARHGYADESQAAP